jgi:glutaminase
MANSLDNLERERAIAIAKMLDGDISVSQRSEYMMSSWRRLTDLEKIVINDKSLKSSAPAAALRAFNSYELTFLSHAAAENNQFITQHWAETVGLSTSDLLVARVGR